MTLADLLNRPPRSQRSPRQPTLLELRCTSKLFPDGTALSWSWRIDQGCCAGLQEMKPSPPHPRLGGTPDSRLVLSGIAMTKRTLIKLLDAGPTRFANCQLIGKTSLHFNAKPEFNVRLVARERLQTRLVLANVSTPTSRVAVVDRLSKLEVRSVAIPPVSGLVRWMAFAHALRLVTAQPERAAVCPTSTPNFHRLTKVDSFQCTVETAMNQHGIHAATRDQFTIPVVNNVARSTEFNR